MYILSMSIYKNLVMHGGLADFHHIFLAKQLQKINYWLTLAGAFFFWAETPIH